MALSGTITGTTNNAQILTKVEWTAAQSVVNNSSTITATLMYKRKNSGYITQGNFSGSITINGVKKNINVGTLKITEFDWVAAGSHTVVVLHNTDGTKTTTIKATGEVLATSLDSTYINGSITLDTIYKKASIVSAPNFSDEQNPTITYENPAGTEATGLAACISLTGDNPDIPYRNISMTGSSYTFSLTEAERNTLRNATTMANSRTVYFYVRSIVNGETFYSKLAKTLTIVNANPTLSPTVVDEGEYSSVLTGAPSTKLIKGYNYMSYKANAAALKGATITSYSVVCGNKSSTAASGYFSNVSSGSFVFTVKDSRGNITTKTISRTVVNYVPLTCALKADNPTTAGNMTLTVSGNYFNGSFGSVSNTLTVEYRYKENDGSFSSWTATTATKNGNKYTASITLTGLNYQSTYTFQARAADAVYNGTGEARKTTGNVVAKTMPIFDWGVNDFAINVPLSIMGMDIAANKVLWSGAMYLQGSHEITLTENISDQASGVVLVFSAYQDGAAKNYDWNFVFIPKHFISVGNGTGISTGLMTSSTMATMGSKYMYVYDKKITGNDNNVLNNVVVNGINVNPKYWVLRYVVGV